MIRFKSAGHDDIQTISAQDRLFSVIHQCVRFTVLLEFQASVCEVSLFLHQFYRKGPLPVLQSHTDVDEAFVHGRRDHKGDLSSVRHADHGRKAVLRKGVISLNQITDRFAPSHRNRETAPASGLAALRMQRIRPVRVFQVKRPHAPVIGIIDWYVIVSCSGGGLHPLGQFAIHCDAFVCEARIPVHQIQIGRRADFPAAHHLCKLLINVQAEGHMKVPGILFQIFLFRLPGLNQLLHRRHGFT